MRTTKEQRTKLQRLREAANYRERGSGFGTLTVNGEFTRMTFNHQIIDDLPDLLADLADAVELLRRVYEQVGDRHAISPGLNQGIAAFLREPEVKP